MVSPWSCSREAPYHPVNLIIAHAFASPIASAKSDLGARMLFEAGTTGTSAVIEVLNDQSSSLLRGKLGQRQGHAQQFADIGEG